MQFVQDDRVRPGQRSAHKGENIYVQTFGTRGLRDQEGHLFQIEEEKSRPWQECFGIWQCWIRFHEGIFVIQVAEQETLVQYYKG